MALVREHRSYDMVYDNSFVVSMILRLYEKKKKIVGVLTPRPCEISLEWEGFTTRRFVGYHGTCAIFPQDSELLFMS